MGGSIIFGSHNKQLAPFSLFEVLEKVGEWKEGGGGRKRKQRRQRGRSSESDALLWLLSYG